MTGLLEIRSLRWLSQPGSKLLLDILRQRDVEARQKGRGSTVAKSNIQLNQIFDLRTGRLLEPNTCFRVEIQAYKAGPAVYLTCVYLPW